MEESVTITVQGTRLEGRMNFKGSEKGVVITHPHPLYGGNMDNPVVLNLAQAFSAAGFTTLRFNFRGTCDSSGTFDNGQGEQEDVRGALEILNDRGISRPVLAGYSFGSWVNAHLVASGINISDHIMVSPPAAFLSFDTVKNLPDTGLIITGELDDIAPPDLILSLIQRWEIDPEFAVLDRGDHFYSTHLNELGSLISAYIS